MHIHNNSSQPARQVSCPRHAHLCSRFEGKEGEAIFQEGDAATHAFVIDEGWIQVCRASPRRVVSFAVAGPGRWLGCRDVLFGSRYSETARALTAYEGCSLSREVIQSLTAGIDPTCYSLFEQIGVDLMERERSVFGLSGMTLKERVADFLLQREGPQRGFPFSVPFGRRMLASLLGASMEALVRILSEFRDCGWIEMKGARFRILKRTHLEELQRPVLRRP